MTLNIANLDKLATYLESLPKDYPHFEMGVYYATGQEDNEDGFAYETEPQPCHLDHQPDPSECGSAGCAIGHGPNAGIPLIKEDESWSGYAVRVFGTHERAHSTGGEYMFGARQGGSHLDAAARIREVISGTITFD